MTPSEYVDVDRELQTCALMTDSEIMQAVSNRQGRDIVSTDDEDDGDEREPVRIANGEAATDIDVARRAAAASVVYYTTHTYEECALRKFVYAAHYKMDVLSIFSGILTYYPFSLAYAYVRPSDFGRFGPRLRM